MHRLHGRRTPYTAIGIRRLPCFRCGEPASEQWQICSDGRLFRPICIACDVALNELVLEFMRHPDRKQLLENYAVVKMEEYRAQLPCRGGGKR